MTDHWPIKARCIACHGAGEVQAYTGSDKRCVRCEGRGYYFLPLGD